MYVDLFKLLLLLVSLATNGAPDDWETAYQFRVSLGYGPGSGPVATASINVDATPIYYRDLGDRLCGLYTGGAIYVSPRARDLGCRDTLEHEIAHAWQLRSYGLLFVLSYPLSPSLWEGERPWEGAPPTQRNLEWPLFRLWFPIGSQY